ncbi:MAG TPA: multicopper oxidase domain-containing protein [Streptosporangiaceae bacterium]
MRAVDPRFTFADQRTHRTILAVLSVLFALPAGAQSFRVQCPTSTITHPDPSKNNSEPAYTAPTTFTCSVPNGCTAANNVGYLVPATNVNGAIKCQQVAGGDGYATMADGTQTYMFSFGPLSGLADIAAGKPGTEFPNVFNTIYPGTVKPGDPLLPGDPATTNGASDSGSGYVLGTLPGTAGAFSYNGAVGLTMDQAYLDTIYDLSEGCTSALSTSTPPVCTPAVASTTVTVVLNAPSFFKVNDPIVVSGTGTCYDNNLPPSPACPQGTPAFWTVSAVNVTNTIFSADQAFQFAANVPGLAQVTTSGTATVASLPGLTGHVDPRPIIDVGVMNGNIPAPLLAIDEDDEFFLTLSNVGMIMRPDLFEQHTIHFHGYPNASSVYDGVPDASVAINIGGSFTYYYLAPDAGTYFWHCHITPPEHLQMGMVGQLYVRPRQDRVPVGTLLYTALQTQQNDLRTACNPGADILCSTNLPAPNATPQALDTVGTALTNPNYGQPVKYAYNDGDGSTRYDAEYPLQIHGFDPNFHFVGMTFNPESFVDMKDKYFLLNGRSYPDTVNPNPQVTQSSDGRVHYSQPLPSIINIPVGGKALLRISDLSVSEYSTLASLGIPMHVIGYNAKLLRDQAGNNMDYYTNSITLGGGESLDVVLDASNTTKYPTGSVFYLYTPQLDHLSNDAENFGGLMTEVHVN